MKIPGVAIETTDYKGRRFDRFEVRRDNIAPGWFVFGRNPEYGDTLIKMVAWIDEPKKRYRGRNCKTVRGWRTKREAQSIADKMNNPQP